MENFWMHVLVIPVFVLWITFLVLKSTSDR